MIFLKVALFLPTVSFTCIFILLSIYIFLPYIMHKNLLWCTSYIYIHFKIKQHDILIPHRKERFFTHVSLIHKLSLLIYGNYQHSFSM